MMNELIFFIYIFVVTLTSIIAARLGKEALIALIALQAVLVNLFVTKQIVLFGLAATASDALAIGISLCLNLLQEYHGRSIAQKSVWIGFFCALFYTFISLLHLTYLPSIADKSQPHFLVLLAPMPRIIAASLFSYSIVQQLDCWLYGFCKDRLLPHHFTLRNYISIASTQLIDTILFSFLGLYGIIEHISNIIVVSYSIKLVIVLTAIPFITLTRRLITD